MAERPSMAMLRLALTMPTLREMPGDVAPTPLQELQLGLLDLVERSRMFGEEVALGFRDYFIRIAAREGARGR